MATRTNRNVLHQTKMELHELSWQNKLMFLFLLTDQFTDYYTAQREDTTRYLFYLDNCFQW